MYRMPMYFFRKTNLKAALLIPLLSMSILAVSVPFTQTTTPTFPVMAASMKISPTLFTKISAQGNSPIDVTIKTQTSDYANLIAEINRLGGAVSYEFKYVGALAASVPADKILELASNNQVTKVYYDAERALSSETFPDGSLPIGGVEPALQAPTILESEGYQTISVVPEEIQSITPNNYWNPTAMGATPIWAEGYMGDGSLVAIIDTGIWTGHFMFAGTNVIGGIDLSYDVGNATYEGWDNPLNHFHGSHVAGILASTGGIIIDASDPLVQSIEFYIGEPLPWYNETLDLKLIWLLGMAPFTDLYIIKVFDHTGGSIPESMVLAGIEHAIDLKLVEGYDLDGISMSLGGGTLYDGRDLEDQLIDYASSVGITVVAAAGNEGPAPMTIGSPGTANTAITVGAAATPVQTRVYWDQYYASLGIGGYLFTSEIPQIYAFSSRGPTSDGRLKPTVAATGIYVLSAYIPVGAGGLAWASGTSMSTPAVSGAVALLNSYAEANLGLDVASPEDYKQAITGGAVWLDGYTEYDQGAGFLNAYNALYMLKEDESLGDEAPELPPCAWLEDISNIDFKRRGWKRTYTDSITDLEPGHKIDYVFKVTDFTGSIKLEITNVDVGTDLLGINSFEVYIHTAKRTVYDYWVDSANVNETGMVFTITDPPTLIEPGYVKITVENDWTSYDVASCDVKITVKPTYLQEFHKFVVNYGTISEGEATDWMEIDVPEDTVKATVKLMWLRDWSWYPTSDLDMYIYWDEGYNFDGATWNSPERVVLESPTTLFVMVSGYTVYAEDEPYVLIVDFELDKPWHH